MLAKSLGKAAYAVGLTLWVVFSLFVGQALASIIVISFPSEGNQAVVATLMAALGYALGLGLALGVPPLASRKLVSKETLGLHRLPTVADVGIGIMSILPYLVLSGIVLWFGMEVLNIINPEVGQQIPFQNLSLRIEYVVAFITLVIMAPLAEEILFRGYFLGRLSEKTGKWVAMLITALVFGLMHLPAFSETGIVLQWSAAIDTFAMGLVVGALRNLSGSIWAGVVLHALKNGVAFYFLFIAQQ